MTEKRFNNEILPLHPLLYKLAVTLLGNREGAEDIVQDVMLKIWSEAPSSLIIKSWKAYCYRMVRNACLTRKAQTHIDDSLEYHLNEESGDSPHNRLETQDALRILRQAIEKLPSDQSEVMKLSVYAGLSNIEIVDITGLSHTCVRSIISRNRKKLKLLFSKI